MRMPECRQMRYATSIRLTGAGRAEARLGCPLLAVFVELLANPLALELREVVDEQLAIDVIHLMLNAHRQDIGVIALENGSSPVLRPDAHLRGSLDLVEDPGHREA